MGTFDLGKQSQLVWQLVPQGALVLLLLLRRAAQGRAEERQRWEWWRSRVEQQGEGFQECDSTVQSSFQKYFHPRAAQRTQKNAQVGLQNLNCTWITWIAWIAWITWIACDCL